MGYERPLMIGGCPSCGRQDCVALSCQRPKRDEFPSLSLMQYKPRPRAPRLPHHRLKCLGHSLWRCRSEGGPEGVCEGFGSSWRYAYEAWKTRITGIRMRLGITP